jgi:hypothetical protein
MSQNRKKLYIDIFVFLLFSTASAPQATGLAFHEWISLAFIPVIIIHLLMSWSWVVGTTLRVFKKRPGTVRFNHLWDTLLFVTMTNVIFSGVVVSEVVLPRMGIPIVPDPFWLAVHDFSSKFFLLFLGIHLAMHWKWVVDGFKRYIARGASPDRNESNFGRSPV